MEQLEMTLYPQRIDFIDCEDYCESDECAECYLCDHFKGDHREEIIKSAEEYKRLLRAVFG